MDVLRCIERTLLYWMYCIEYIVLYVLYWMYCIVLDVLYCRSWRTPTYGSSYIPGDEELHSLSWTGMDTKHRLLLSQSQTTRQ